jgi:hypothetical protein
VVIWCKEFGVLISPATLRAGLSSAGGAAAKRSLLSIAGHVPATFAPKL